MGAFEDAHREVVKRREGLRSETPGGPVRLRPLGQASPAETNAARTKRSQNRAQARRIAIAEHQRERLVRASEAAARHWIEQWAATVDAPVRAKELAFDTVIHESVGQPIRAESWTKWRQINHDFRCCVEVETEAPGMPTKRVVGRVEILIEDVVVQEHRPANTVDEVKAALAIEELPEVRLRVERMAAKRYGERDRAEAARQQRRVAWHEASQRRRHDFWWGTGSTMPGQGGMMALVAIVTVWLGGPALLIWWIVHSIGH